jgi:hypothetical protein
VNENISSTIKQLADMLSQDKMPENLKDLVSLFSGAIENNSNTRQISANQANEQSLGKKNLYDQELNPEMINMVKTLMRKLDTKNDPRINLLMALRPFLNSNRQKKLGNCIKLLQITSLFEDLEKIENLNL